jgi:hypothetical protein
MSSNRRKVGAVLVGCAIFGAASCCAPPTYNEGPDFGPDPGTVEDCSSSNPVGPCTPSQEDPVWSIPPGEEPSCFLLDWHNAIQFDRTSELYGTWTFEDDGSVYGYSKFEDEPIYLTITCALNDGDLYLP